ncbi:FUSC family protein [Pseudomonas parafulva]|uniref:FUSC family protein n=1 Tax=Pseudomonas parafulva TaxID=157782 RepID=UPI00041321A8|nr:FUSC family protein [Pseudomonas parafulva]
MTDVNSVEQEQFGLRFIIAEMKAYPGRLNLVLRTVLSCAVVILVSMSLQVPLLALSLLVVFYVTQSNVVITRLVGTLFLLGTTLAIAASILLLKFTYAYPLLRILGAATLFFISAYLMRVTAIGVVFFIVGIVVIYVQTFADTTDQPELVVRSVLWVWVAVCYSIAVTLCVNTLFLPLEPWRQLQALVARQLDSVAQLLTGAQPVPHIDARHIQRTAISLQQLLRFACMRDHNVRQEQALHLARVNAVCRLLMLTAHLNTDSTRPPEAAELSRAVLALKLMEPKAATHALSTLDRLGTRQLPGVYEEIRTTLLSLSLPNFAGAAAPAPKPPVLAADAFSNPRYAQFALKTLLAAMLCYLFYMATDWPGIHTIMLTCLIVAQPSLGATWMKASLRVGGALFGSGLALVMLVWVIPHLTGIVGLMFMTLPVMALAAWVATGSERISYAGVQIMFTFSLALLETFGPSTNLTDVRDRMIGIVMGVVISVFIHAVLWPEAEGEALQRSIGRLLQRISANLRMPTPATETAALWAEIGQCEAALARVAIEPSWQAGETHQEHMTYRLQQIIASARYLLMANHALQIEIEHGSQSPGDAHVLDEIRAAMCAALDHGRQIFEQPDIQPSLERKLALLQAQAQRNIRDPQLRRRVSDTLHALGALLHR